MKHKITFITLIFTLCVVVARAETVTIDKIKYILDGQEAVVDQQDATLSGKIVIPQTVSVDGQSYVVTEMMENAFANTKVRQVTLPEGMTTLPMMCFYWCESLQTVVLPSTITSIGDYCFLSCSKLSTINIPEGVTSLGRMSFSYCGSLASLQLPSTLTEIGGACFSYCSSLSELALPDNISQLGTFTFQACSALETMRVPRNVSVIPSACFTGCSHLTTLLLHDGVTELGERAFANTAMTTVDLPESITRIERNCFEGATLETVYVHWDTPESCTIADTCFNTYLPAVLYVPAGKTALYDGMVWTKSFAMIAEETESSGVGDVSDETVPAVSLNDGSISISGMGERERVAIYNSAGHLLATTLSANGKAVVTVPSGERWVVVSIKGRAWKVVMKQ